MCHRKVALSSFAVMAAVLLAASAAYACTVFDGRAQVTIAASSLSGAGSADVKAKPGTMSWCPGGTNSLQIADNVGLGASTVINWIQTATTKCDGTGTNKLPPGGYVVTYGPGSDSTWPLSNKHNCHAANGAASTLLGTMEILPDGSNGPTGDSYAVPASRVAPGAGSICVWNEAFPNAMAVLVNGV